MSMIANWIEHDRLKPQVRDCKTSYILLFNNKTYVSIDVSYQLTFSLLYELHAGINVLKLI